MDNGLNTVALKYIKKAEKLKGLPPEEIQEGMKQIGDELENEGISPKVIAVIAEKLNNYCIKTKIIPKPKTQKTNGVRKPTLQQSGKIAEVQQAR